MRELGEPRRQLRREDVELLERGEDRRLLGSERPVLHLEREPEPAPWHRHRVHPFGPDLRDHLALRLLEEYRVEALGAPQEMRMRADGRRDRDAIASPSWIAVANRA